MKNYFTQNTWSPLEKHRARGQPHGHANCVVRQGPGLMLCSHHFENLNTFMCECLCYERSPVVQWSYTQAEEAVCVSFLPCHPVCTVSMMPHKLRILVDLWRIGTQSHKMSTRQAYHIYDWFRSGDSSKRLCFPSEPGLASEGAERRQRQPKKHKWPENPIISFPTSGCYFPVRRLPLQMMT